MIIFIIGNIVNIVVIVNILKDDDHAWYVMIMARFPNLSGWVELGCLVPHVGSSI